MEGEAPADIAAMRLPSPMAKLIEESGNLLEALPSPDSRALLESIIHGESPAALAMRARLEGIATGTSGSTPAECWSALPLPSPMTSLIEESGRLLEALPSPDSRALLESIMGGESPAALAMSKRLEGIATGAPGATPAGGASALALPSPMTSLIEESGSLLEALPSPDSRALLGSIIHGHSPAAHAMRTRIEDIAAEPLGATRRADPDDSYDSDEDRQRMLERRCVRA